MSPRRLRLAWLISVVSHGLFILTARYRLSYDAYTHMLFADHYARDWFSLWETRWYTGFEVVSYPPLTHQLIALLVPLIGFDAAYALILWTVTGLYPLGIYAFARIFAGRAAASYAALACALLLPLYVTAHIFGQLPYLTSTLFALFGAASLARYLREGGNLNLSLTVALAATTMAAHHATLLVQPFLILAVVVAQIGKTNSRGLLARLVLFGMLAALASLLVIWPFWEWATHQTLQTPIDHPSRHNLLTDAFARTIFFWPLYGPLVVLIPFIYYKWPARFWGLTASFTILFVFGLGGTTRLPALVFGEAWEWLTYDRFTVWASLTLLPFFGVLFILLKRRWNKFFVPRLIPAALRTRLIPALSFSVFAATALGSWLTPYLFPSQPEPIEMQPIVDFLEEGEQSEWRYLTLGFGNQFAYLNLLTDATTIDGSYNTARNLPELRASGIAEIDTVFWSSQGIPAIRPILRKSGEYGVRWVFVNSKQFMIPEMHKKGWRFVNRGNFAPELRSDGWVFVEFLRNGVQVWENPNAKLPPPMQPPPANPWASFSWGVFPLLALSLTCFMTYLHFARLLPEHRAQSRSINSTRQEIS